MTRPEDKEKEKKYAEELVRLLPQLGIIGEPTIDECPDIILSLPNSRSAGLEIVRAVDEGVAAGRGVKAKMKKRLLAGLREAELNVHLHFSISDDAAGALATQSMKEQLAAEILSLVELAKRGIREQPTSDGPWRRYLRFRDIAEGQGTAHWRDRDRDRGFCSLEGSGIEFCRAVSVRPDDKPRATWSGTGPGQSANIIQEAIDAKAKKLPEYRKKGYDEQWLLVVGSSTDGGALDISDAEAEFSSPFDRTFFLELFEGECVELQHRR